MRVRPRTDSRRRVTICTKKEKNDPHIKVRIKIFITSKFIKIFEIKMNIKIGFAGIFGILNCF